MIAVNKGNEPEGLSNLREACKKEGMNPKEAYKRLSGELKQRVLSSLRNEQGDLCVYCMCKLPRHKKNDNNRDGYIADPTIEHYIPLEYKEDKGQGLDYQNLFAACSGNQHIHERGEHRNSSLEALICDKHKGNVLLKKIHPLKPESLQTIKYSVINGEIFSDDADVQYDLNTVLNLNSRKAPVMGERKSALDSLISDIGLEKEEDIYEYCVKRLAVFEKEKEKKTPYVGILIWYLKTIIEALEIQK